MGTASEAREQEIEQQLSTQAAMNAPTLTLYRGHYPAITADGRIVVVFYATAAGFSKCIALLSEVRAEMLGEKL